MKKDTEKRFYDSVRWRKARSAYLTENPLCIFCARAGRDIAADTIDHIETHGGNYQKFWDRENWQSLCKACHDTLKREQEHRGFSGMTGIDGQPLDPNHPWNRKEI